MPGLTASLFTLSWVENFSFIVVKTHGYVILPQVGLWNIDLQIVLSFVFRHAQLGCGEDTEAVWLFLSLILKF